MKIIKCRCLIKTCNHEWYTTWDCLNRGYQCPKYSIENMKGENNPNWNQNKTDEERIFQRKYLEYSNFIKSVLKRDNYSCDITGQIGGRLVIHHLNGYNWFVEGRTDIKNAVTLSEEIHKEFHKIYGYGKNTEEQYDEFKKNKLFNKTN